MRYLLPLLLLIAATAFATTPAHAWGEGRAKRKADEWVGRDASELLLQLRVDGGRVEIEEDEATDETRYIFRTWDDAYYKTVVTGSDQHMIGVDRGTPIYQETVYTDQVFVPAQHRCTIVFTADPEGIIRHWRYEGDVCVQDIKRPKNRD
ncbi:hypothetical protein [Lysobacter humi (ex Lee et al. 2017)]